jgi:hypothetical protein
LRKKFGEVEVNNQTLGLLLFPSLPFPSLHYSLPLFKIEKKKKKLSLKRVRVRAVQRQAILRHEL